MLYRRKKERVEVYQWDGRIDTPCPEWMSVFTLLDLADPARRKLKIPGTDIVAGTDDYIVREDNEIRVYAASKFEEIFEPVSVGPNPHPLMCAYGAEEHGSVLDQRTGRDFPYTLRLRLDVYAVKPEDVERESHSELNQRLETIVACAAAQGVALLER